MNYSHGASYVFFIFFLCGVDVLVLQVVARSLVSSDAQRSQRDLRRHEMP